MALKEGIVIQDLRIAKFLLNQELSVKTAGLLFLLLLVPTVAVGVISREITLGSGAQVASWAWGIALVGGLMMVAFWGVLIGILVSGMWLRGVAKPERFRKEHEAARPARDRQGGRAEGETATAA